MHRPGIEPGSRGWQPRILPLDHRCSANLPLLSCRLLDQEMTVLSCCQRLNYYTNCLRLPIDKKKSFGVLDVAFLGCCRTANRPPIIIVWGSFGLPGFFLRFHFLLGRVRRPQGKRSYQKANQGGASIRFMATTMCT